MIVIASSIAGCTLLLVSTDGLTGGSIDDAGAATIDGQGGDGGDAGNPGPSSDSGIDPSFDARAGDADASLPFCASHPNHTFCDDFDDGNDVTTKWTSNDVDGRGMIRSDTVISRSPPRSFEALTPAGSSVVSVATLARSVGEVSRMRLAFDVQITAPSGSVGVRYRKSGFGTPASF